LTEIKEDSAESITKPKESMTKTKSFFIGKHLIASIAIILCVGALCGFYGYNELGFNPTGQVILSNNNTVDTSGKPLVELFVMSQCPYGTQAEDALIPVIQSFENKIDFKLNFIASESDSGFSSLHGQPEVNEDIRQVCIAEKYSQEKLFDYLTCVNQDITNVESNWKTCAEQSGIDVSAIESCSTGEEGKNLLKENIKRSNELMIGSSPSYYINNEPYSGGRASLDLTRTFCSFVEAEVCSTLPEETEVNLFVVNDPECVQCDADTIIAQLQSLFPNLNTTKIDFTSDKGKEMLDKFQAETVPFFYFDSTATEHYNWDQFSYYTQENDGLYSLNYLGTKFFNRTVKENHIDLFVMSQCPYGTLAETNMKEVAEAIPDMTYNLYFIASETETGFDSLHGQVEVNEDIRQTCIIKNDRTKLLDYQACVNEDIANVEGNWKACAIKTGIDVSTIESCSTGEEGKQLLSDSIKETNSLGIGSSPTFIVNGQILFRAGSPEGIKEVLCSYNDLVGCDQILTGSTTTTSGSC